MRTFYTEDPMRMTFLLLALTAAAALPRDAAAQHFRFEVPVALSDLPPDVTRADITCFLLTAAAGGRELGQGSATIPIAGGSYMGTITVPVNSVGDPSLGRAYNCRLILNGVEAITLFNPPDRPGIRRFDSRAGSEYSVWFLEPL